MLSLTNKSYPQANMSETTKPQSNSAFDVRRLAFCKITLPGSCLFPVGSSLVTWLDGSRVETTWQTLCSCTQIKKSISLALEKCGNPTQILYGGNKNTKHFQLMIRAANVPVFYLGWRKSLQSTVRQEWLAECAWCLSPPTTQTEASLDATGTCKYDIFVLWKINIVRNRS